MPRCVRSAICADVVEDAHDHLLADDAAGGGHAEVDMLPSTLAEKLPSCGLRFSVMSRSASTLKMLSTASPIGRLNGSVGCRMPSMRKRTVISSLVGSRWMSVARRCDGLVDHLTGRLVALDYAARADALRRPRRGRLSSCR